MYAVGVYERGKLIRQTPPHASYPQVATLLNILEEAERASSSRKGRSAPKTRFKFRIIKTEDSDGKEKEDKKEEASKQ